MRMQLRVGDVGNAVQSAASIRKNSTANPIINRNRARRSDASLPASSTNSLVARAKPALSKAAGHQRAKQVGPKGPQIRIGQFAGPPHAAAALRGEPASFIGIGRRFSGRAATARQPLLAAGESESVGPASGSSAIVYRRWCRSRSTPIAAAALPTFSAGSWRLPDSNRRHRRQSRSFARQEWLETDFVAQTLVHPMLFVADEGRHGDKAFIRRFAHHFQIGMRAGRHLHAGRALLAGVQQCRRPLGAKQRLSQFQSERALADTRRADE